MLLEGLSITVIGLAWVFAGLALVWVLVALLNRLFPGKFESKTQASIWEPNRTTRTLQCLLAQKHSRESEPR